MNDDAAVQTGLTPLHAAVRHGHVDMTAALLAKGAHVNATDEVGLTTTR